jgi:hypothetical protein
MKSTGNKKREKNYKKTWKQMFTLSKDALLHTEDVCCALCTGILKMKSTGNKKREKKLSEAGNKCLLFQKMHISTLRTPVARSTVGTQ